MFGKVDSSIRDNIVDRFTRWRPIIIATIVIVAVNLITRVISRLVIPDNQEDLIPGLITYGLTVIAAAAVTLWRIRLAQLSRVCGEMTLAVLIAAVIIVFVGPYASGGSLSGGTLLIVGRCGLTFLVCWLGIGLGLLTGIALGWDWRSRALRAYARKPGSRRL